MKIDLGELLNWIQKAKITRFRKQVLLVAISAVVYSIWLQRNKKIWCREEFKTEEVTRRVLENVKRRARIIGLPKCNIIDSNWFMEL